MRATYVQILVCVLAAVLFVACSANRSNKPNNGSPSNQSAEGGVDSSGGETPRSKAEEIDNAVKEQLANLPGAYHRIQAFFDERAAVEEMRKVLDGRKKTEEAPQMDANDSRFNVFTHESSALFERIFSKVDEQTVYQKIEMITLHPQEAPCTGEFKDPRDMSVTAKGEVCYSYERLVHIPPQELAVHILALLSMESSHLMNFDRTDATSVRDWFLAHGAIVNATPANFSELSELLSKIKENLHQISFNRGSLDTEIDRAVEQCAKIRTGYIERKEIQLPVLIENDLGDICRKTELMKSQLRDENTDSTQTISELEVLVDSTAAKISEYAR